MLLRIVSIKEAGARGSEQAFLRIFVCGTSLPSTLSLLDIAVAITSGQLAFFLFWIVEWPYRDGRANIKSKDIHNNHCIKHLPQFLPRINNQDCRVIAQKQLYILLPPPWNHVGRSLQHFCWQRLRYDGDFSRNTRFRHGAAMRTSYLRVLCATSIAYYRIQSPIGCCV